MDGSIRVAEPRDAARLADLAAEIAEPETRTLVAEEADGPAGFAQLRRADRLMAETFGLGDGTIWLLAYADNPRAIAFYRRSGFDPIDTLVPRVGNVDMPTP